MTLHLHPGAEHMHRCSSDRAAVGGACPLSRVCVWRVEVAYEIAYKYEYGWRCVRAMPVIVVFSPGVCMLLAPG